MDLIVIPPADQLPVGTRPDSRNNALERIENRALKFLKEAIEHKIATGVEQQWLEDEAYYESRSLDGVNRNSRPALQDGPRSGDGGERRKSRIFLNVVQPYTDTAAAHLSNVVLPDGETPWSIKPTVLPTLQEISGGDIPTDIDAAIEAEAMEENQMLGQPFNDEQMAAAVAAKREQVVAQAKRIVNRADQAARRAAKQIEDWQTECDAKSQLRKLVTSACRIGTGAIREPVVEVTKALAYEGGKLRIVHDVKPVSRWVDAWNLYPDPICGTDIQHGEFHIERDTVTRRTLREYANDQSYFTDRIADLLEDEGHMLMGGERRAESKAQKMGLPQTSSKRLIDLWICYMEVSRSDLVALGAEFEDSPVIEGEEIIEVDDEGASKESLQTYHPVRVTLANDTIIQITSSEMPDGSFPYSYFTWTPRAELPWGMGIVRQLHDIQRMILNASRVMMENAGVAGGPMVVINKSVISPEDGQWKIEPWKIWTHSGGGDVDGNVGTEAHFQFINVDMHQQAFQAIIELALKLAEDVTGMPVLLGGRHTDTTPDTVGGMKLLNTNASAPLARQARRLDDAVIKPGVERFYKFAVSNGRLEDFQDADMQVEASGSESMIQRNLQNQAIREIGEMVKDPTFGMDPRKYSQQLLKSMGLKHIDYMFDDPEWMQVVQQMQEQPPDVRLQIAEMNASIKQMQLQQQSQDKQLDREVELEIERMRRESGDLKTQIDAMKAEMGREIKQEEMGERERERYERTRLELQELTLKLDSMFKTEAMRGATQRAVAREQRQQAQQREAK